MNTDPTIQEMREFLYTICPKLTDVFFQGSDGLNFDVEASIWWFSNNYHSGQFSNLYKALCQSEFKPSPLHNSIKDEQSDVAEMLYEELVKQFGN